MITVEEVKKLKNQVERATPTAVFYELLEKLPRVEHHLVESYTRGMLNLIEMEKKLKKNNDD